MKILGWEIRKAIAQDLPEAKQNQFETVLAQLRAVRDGGIGDVTPDNCMRSPTVHAIVTAITRRFAVTPVHVYRKTMKNGREFKEKLPSHPVAKLLAYPNSYQSRVEFWQDAASWFARWGRFHAFKSRGTTGPIRELLPMQPANVCVKQDPLTWRLTFEWGQNAELQTYPASKIFYARGPARNGYSGDSPVKDVAQAIALEIAAEKFGSTFFENGAVPLMIFQYMQNVQASKDPDFEKRFVEDIQAALTGGRRHRGLFLPKGIESKDPVVIENDKSQFLETRKYQRTVIAGAWGVPPHLVGELERATFNNVEQQDGDFTLNVIMPIAQAFESAMERDLLTDEDTNSGVVIRFNLDSILRADFKSRQEGLQIQRQNGAISPNEWREIEGRNPISDEDGGDDYIRPANMVVAGEPLPTPPGPREPAAAKPAAEEAADKFMDAMRDLAQKVTAPASQPIVIHNHMNPTTDVTVNVDPAQIKVDGPEIEVHPQRHDIQIPVAVQIDSGDVQVRASDVTVHHEPGQTLIKNEVPATPVTVNVPPAQITVEPATVTVNNEVKTPDVHVAQPDILIPPATVNVAPSASEVIVHNEVKTPVVNVEPAQVHVENNVAPPEVKIENTVEPPIVHVESPTVNVKAPNVTVHNDLPTYEAVEQDVVRDKQGRITKTITTRKKKG